MSGGRVERRLPAAAAGLAAACCTLHVTLLAAGVGALAAAAAGASLVGVGVLAIAGVVWWTIRRRRPDTSHATSTSEDLQKVGRGGH
jgi:hypothetical protein